MNPALYGPGYGPAPGVSAYPPQWTYAPAPMSQYGASYAQAGAMGLMGGIPAGIGAVSMGAGLAQMGGQAVGWGAKQLGMTALAGQAAGVAGSKLLLGASLLDPTTAAFMGSTTAMGAAGGFGTALGSVGGFARVGAAGVMGGAAAMLNPITLGAMAVTQGLGSMYDGAKHQARFNSMMAANNGFASGTGIGGRGFSYGQMSGMMHMAHQIDKDDPFASMKDITGVMGRFNEFGMNQGVRDAEQISKKMKDMVTAVRSMAKTLGTTLEEASGVFGAMRGAGFYTGADILGNTRRMGVAKANGLSNQGFMEMQYGGANTTRGRGMGGQAGATAATNVYEELTAAQRMKVLSAEEMMDATGTGNAADAAKQMGLNVTGGLTSFYNDTGVGQAMLAAIGQMKDGKFTGGIDNDLVARLQSGEIDINNLVAQGQKRLGSRDAKLSFVTKNPDIAAGLMKSEGAGGATALMMKSIAGDKFGDMDPENLVQLMSERLIGLDRKTAESMVKLMKESQKIRGEVQGDLQREFQQRAYEIDMRENRSLEGVLSKAKQQAYNMTLAHAEEAGAAVYTSLGQTSERIGNTVFGRTRVGSDEKTRNEAIINLAQGRSTGSVDATTGLVPYLTGAGMADSQAIRMATEAMAGGSAQFQDVPLSDTLSMKYYRPETAIMDDLVSSYKNALGAEGATSGSALSSFEIKDSGSWLAFGKAKGQDVLTADPKLRAAFYQRLQKEGLYTADAARLGETGYYGSLEEAQSSLRTTLKDAIQSGDDYSVLETGQDTLDTLQETGGLGLMAEFGRKKLGRKELMALNEKALTQVTSGVTRDDALVRLLKEKGIATTSSAARGAFDYLARSDADTGLFKKVEGILGGQQQLSNQLQLQGLTSSYLGKEDGIGAELATQMKNLDVALRGSGNTADAMAEFMQAAEAKYSGNLGALYTQGALGQASAEGIKTLKSIRGMKKNADVAGALGFSEDQLARLGVSVEDGSIDVTEEKKLRAALLTRGTESYGMTATEGSLTAISDFNRQTLELAKYTTLLAGQVSTLETRVSGKAGNTSAEAAPVAGSTGAESPPPPPGR